MLFRRCVGMLCIGSSILSLGMALLTGGEWMVLSPFSCGFVVMSALLALYAIIALRPH